MYTYFLFKTKLKTNQYEFYEISKIIGDKFKENYMITEDKIIKKI